MNLTKRETPLTSMRTSHFPQSAPTVLGALFFLLLSLGLVSCQQKDAETPDWEEEPVEVAVETTEVEPEPEPKKPAPPEEKGYDELRFVSYNLKNYLKMSRYIDGERQFASKPEEEIEAVVRLLSDSKPDVLGLCEIGREEDVLDLQKRLKEAGTDLPYYEHAGGSDKTRHLAFLSRYPIASTNSQSELFYELEGERTQIRRGILHATVDFEGDLIHFLGAHLKSKREIPEADQELIRRNEAYLLRQQADSILKEDKTALVVAYGDFNDTKRSTAVRSISGPGNSNAYLEPIYLEDNRGEVWTHFWKYQHVYSRFDYVMVSKELRPWIVEEESYIIDHPDNDIASDHRALLVTFVR